MPKVSDEDRQFAARLGNVLRELREKAASIEGDEEWTQERAAEKIGISTTTLGRWERGDNAPKGYDLGRLFRTYERFGADWRWFFDPPEVIVTNPVRDLLHFARGATASAQRHLEVEEVRPRAAGGKRVAQHGRRGR